MAHHANFAAVLAISESLAQSILRTYYSNGAFPVEIADNLPLPKKNHPETGEPLPPRFVSFDLILAEPRLNFEQRPEADDRIAVNIRLSGDASFTSPELETINIQVQVDFKVAGLLETFDTGTSLQFGINLGFAPVTDFTVKRFSGSDPLPMYGFDLNTELLPFIAAAIWTLDTTQWRITPPQLDDVRSAGLVTAQSISVRTFGSSATIGINIENLTTGDANQLIDLFGSNLENGFYRIYSPSGSSYDDEYGASYTEGAWSNFIKPPPGPHAGELALSVNNVLLQRLFDDVFRQQILDAFEEEKQRKIDAAHQKAEDTGTEFKEPKIAKVEIDEINFQLTQDFLGGIGEISYDGIGDIDFEFGLRPYHTMVENAGITGFGVKVEQIDVDHPVWLDVLTALSNGLDILRVPVSTLVLPIIRIMVSSALAKGESKIGKGLAKILDNFKGHLRFDLPGINGPEFSISFTDMVIDPDGINTWASAGVSPGPRARLELTKYPGSDKWPVMDRSPLTVALVSNYNFSHPDDDRVRIRWEVFAEHTSKRIIYVDWSLSGQSDAQIENPREIRIHHASEDLEAYERYIVRVRVYRPFGADTIELFSEEKIFEIRDRLKREKPYVKWSRGGEYRLYSHRKGHPERKKLGWIQEMRHYAIHKTDPDERCFFADQYTPHLQKHELDYIDQLPFPVSEIKNSLDKICEYCFFGGPDKTNNDPLVEPRPHADEVSDKPIRPIS